MTLLEFGQRNKSDSEKSSTDAADVDATEAEELLALHSDETFKLSAKVITNLVQIQSEELQRAADQYSLLREKASFISNRLCHV